jgi:hypothetical protein
MLGYLITDGEGTADRLLAEVADALVAEGWPLAGAVQINSDAGSGRRCNMDLNVLAEGRIIRISQNLGKFAKGCRLDPDGLEQAVGLVARALSGPVRPRLLIVNRFGKQEADGRGFRSLIGQALADGIPVLTSVGRANMPVFHAFADGFAEELAPVAAELLDWCHRGA